VACDERLGLPHRRPRGPEDERGAARQVSLPGCASSATALSDLAVMAARPAITSGAWVSSYFLAWLVSPCGPIGRPTDWPAVLGGQKRRQCSGWRAARAGPPATGDICPAGLGFLTVDCGSLNSFWASQFAVEPQSFDFSGFGLEGVFGVEGFLLGLSQDPQKNPSSKSPKHRACSFGL
jgi:hypothetical protein